MRCARPHPGSERLAPAVCRLVGTAHAHPTEDALDRCPRGSGLLQRLVHELDRGWLRDAPAFKDSALQVALQVPDLRVRRAIDWDPFLSFFEWAALRPAGARAHPVPVVAWVAGEKPVSQLAGGPGSDPPKPPAQESEADAALGGAAQQGGADGAASKGPRKKKKKTIPISDKTIAEVSPRAGRPRAPAGAPADSAS